MQLPMPTPLALAAILCCASRLASATSLAGFANLASRADPPLFSVLNSSAPRPETFYCEPIEFSWATDGMSSSALTTNLSIAVFDVTLGRPGNFTFLYQSVTGYNGTSYVWTPDVPAGKQYSMQVFNSTVVGTRANGDALYDPTSRNILFISFGTSFVNTSTKECNQSALRLGYDPASVVSAGLLTASSSAATWAGLAVAFAALSIV